LEHWAVRVGALAAVDVGAAGTQMERLQEGH
jgi:hypothetical protein